MSQRKPYPSDVRDEEWAFVAPYLTLLPALAKQRKHSLREVFNGLRWIVRTGSPWRYMPHDLPPHDAVFQQTQRWIKAGAFAAITHDLRSLLRLLEGRTEQPSAAVFDSRSLRSTRESGARAGLDPYKKMRGSKVHMAVDPLGHPLAAVGGGRWQALVALHRGERCPSRSGSVQEDARLQGAHGCRYAGPSAGCRCHPSQYAGPGCRSSTRACRAGGHARDGRSRIRRRRLQGADRP